MNSKYKNLYLRKLKKEFKNNIAKEIEVKRFENSLKRDNYKKYLKRLELEKHLKIKAEFNGKITYEKTLLKWLPANISYIIDCKRANFSILSNLRYSKNEFIVPTNFSLIDNPKESYEFIKDLTIGILSLKKKNVEIDYSKCKNVDLGAQIYLDIILKDLFYFIKKCRRSLIKCPVFPTVDAVGITNMDIHKMLFSVGSVAIHKNKSKHFSDIIAYPLCIHNKNSNTDRIQNLERKEIDSTNLVQYVIDSLKRLNKELTPEKIDDFSTIIGEILINAEEHSTNNYRFSTGYFQEHEINGEHYGVFNLVILNFGETIYQKFKSESCVNFDIINTMTELSENYTEKKLFSTTFKEETLWTLYALQEGVTSVSKERYKRGNGSIRFIESFFNIKGEKKKVDDLSRLTLLSGNTNITFDGTYNITEKGKFKVMAFNKSGNIEDKPDKKFVKYTSDYFPGTMISAKILINKDDVI